jgi:hypothetical protein
VKGRQLLDRHAIVVQSSEPSVQLYRWLRECSPLFLTVMGGLFPLATITPPRYIGLITRSTFHAFW